MQVTYIDKLFLQTDRQETEFIMNQRRTCYNGIYPYKIFPQKRLREISFAPITIFYGGNGSGKTTLLNIIAEKTKVIRHSARFCKNICNTVWSCLKRAGKKTGGADFAALGEPQNQRPYTHS